MSDATSIEWTDATWSPLRARRKDNGKVGQHCERVSAGCTHCYAARHNGRNLPSGGTGLDYVRASRDLVETVVDERVLAQPLRWRAPRKVFVCNQTDLFADFYTDEQRDHLFAAMSLANWHTYQVLTKRPERMRDYLAGEARERISEVPIGWVPRRMVDRGFDFEHQWPMPHVWFGVSVENQATADERIPILFDTPAAVRFASVEPLIAPIHPSSVVWCRDRAKHRVSTALDWIIVGGESGRNARPCEVAWIRAFVSEALGSSVPVFVKQLGARPEIANDSFNEWPAFRCHAQGEVETRPADYVPRFQGEAVGIVLADAKGGDPDEWPEDLRVREFPRADRTVPA